MSELMPALRAVVTQRHDVPDDFGDAWVRVGSTDDPEWPVDLVFAIFPDPSPLDPHPDLRIAEHLFRAFGVDVIAGTYEAIAPDLDPHDPYWCLALVRGEWHLGDTIDTLLHGPGVREDGPPLGDRKLRLVRPVYPWEVPTSGS